MQQNNPTRGDGGTGGRGDGETGGPIEIFKTKNVQKKNTTLGINWKQ